MIADNLTQTQQELYAYVFEKRNFESILNFILSLWPETIAAGERMYVNYDKKTYKPVFADRVHSQIDEVIGRLEYADIFQTLEHSLYVSIHKALFYVNVISLAELNIECIKVLFEEALKELLLQVPSTENPNRKQIDNFIRSYFEVK